MRSAGAILALYIVVVIGQEIGIPVNVDVLITGSFIFTDIVRCIQAEIVTDIIGQRSADLKSDTTVCAGEVLIIGAVGHSLTDRIAIGKDRALSNRFLTGTVCVTVNTNNGNYSIPMFSQT